MKMLYASCLFCLGFGILKISGLKGSVSPDTEIYFRVKKIESVLSIGQLMVYALYYFVLPEIF
jgi:hypothetical protein